MKAKILILLSVCILVGCLTGCYEYTVFERNDTKNSSINEKANQEELDAMNNSPILSTSGMKIWEKIKQLDGYVYSYDKKGDTVKLKSNYLEITSGGEEINTIYFIIYKGHPLDDDETMSELYKIIGIISSGLNVDYNEDAIIESISNVDYSKALKSYKNNYSSNIELFSILWNDGTKDCVDFRIQPK